MLLLHQTSLPTSPCFHPQHDTIDKVLQRGEKLDDLVEKSEELGLQSKAFYKTVIKSQVPITPAGLPTGSVLSGGWLMIIC